MTAFKIRASLISKVVAAALDLSERDIYSGFRDPDIVRARHACWWLARRIARWHYTRIGEEFGRDHTTVCHGIEKTDERRAADPEFAAVLDAIDAALRASVSSDDVRVCRLNAAGRETDVIAAAARITRGDAIRNATTASALEVAGLAYRVLALDAIAAAVAALLYEIDAFVVARPADGGAPADIAHARALRGRIATLTETLSGALVALGYSQEDTHDQEEARGDDVASAAIA